MSDNKKKKGHTKSGLVKIGTAILTVAGILIGLGNGKGKNT